MKVVYRVRDLCKEVGTDVVTQALRGVHLDVVEGEFLAIMGPSGAGKSTLLNMLGLLDTPTSGSLELGGRDVSKLSSSDRDRLRAHTLSFVFQESHAIPYETVEGNIALALAIKGVPFVERETLVLEAMARVGLVPRVGVLARNLSGGERQRLAIARALVSSPEVILADEPTGNLDSTNAALVLDLLVDLAASGVTVILITHDKDVASRADRTIHLKDGKVLPSGPTTTTRKARTNTVTVSALPKQRWFARLREQLTQGLSSVSLRPARSLVVALAFALGAGGLVASFGLGASAAQQVSDRLEGAALSQVRVSLPAGLTWKQATKVLGTVSLVPQVKQTAIFQRLDASNADVRSTNGRDVSQSAFDTIGADSKYLAIQNADVVPHSAQQLLDSSGRVAIVGSIAAKQLGVGPYQGAIWVQHRLYQVVGVISGAHASSFQRTILLNAESSPTSSYDLLIKTAPGFPAAVADAVPYAVTPQDPGATLVETPVDLRSLRRGVADDLSALVGVTGLVVLVVAVLGAAAAMFLAVLARVPEIALRRALGASKATVASIFVIEGVILGLAGGLAGAALGVGVTVLVAATQGWSAVLPATAVPLSIAVGGVGGAVSSLLPALRAGRVAPAEAIR